MNRVYVVSALAAVVAAAGVAGLIRGAVPQSAAAGPAASASSAATAPITVTGAYVREPASPGEAAAYLTMNNTTGTADTLTSVVSGAGAKTEIHADDMTASGGIVIPPHSKVTLVPGRSHIMLEQLYGPVVAGQTVNLELIFANAGGLIVAAPVIGVTAPVPTS